MAPAITKCFRLCCSKLALFLCSLGLTCPCLAGSWCNDDYNNTNQDQFFNNNHSRLDFIPVSMMDDDALIESAKMRRDGSMNDQVRLLNSQWLMQDRNNTWSGGKAVGKILKTGLKRFLTARYLMKRELVEQPIKDTEDLPLWSNYTVSLSGDKLIVGLRYQF